ncbi:hypothetical protein HC362_33325 [Streptomyces sp. 891-h]|nr:Ig-like domain-containing protein [Streptomyces sp. 891-h]UNZ21235.1 hypothetical protein HC362_33325 [Streptomyces sp. 891-h]
MDGVARATHTYTSTGGSPYALTAAYTGDANFAPSSDSAQQAVAKAPTSTTVLSSPEPSNPAASTSVTARVVVEAPGAGQPTGTVTIDFGDGTPAAVQTLVNGVATVDHVYPAVESTYTITASYSGNTNYAASTDVATHRVLSGVQATTTTVVSSPDPSTAWQPVTFTATVTPVSSGVPTGTVTFNFGDGTPDVTVPLSVATAAVSHTYTSGSGSPYAVIATFTSDDGTYSSSVGYDFQTVTGAPTSTTVSSSPEPSVVGQPVTFTATVTPHAAEAAAPGGTVIFDFGDGTAPLAAPLENGTALIDHAYSATPGSPYTVTATYDGNADFTASSGTDTHTVNRAPTSTTLASVPNPSVVGEAVTLTATVVAEAPGAGTPTGTVTFDFGDGTAPVVLPLTEAVATTDHTYASAGGSPYQATVTYGGDADFAASTGTDTHRVRRASITTTVASTPDPSVVGEPVAFTATVAPVAPGAGSPTGTVVFDFGDGTASVVLPLTGGTATTTHAYTTRTGNPYTVVADYSGDVDFLPLPGTKVHTVERALTATTVTSEPDPSVVGQPVTFTATVAPLAPGAGTPTGTITFNFGDGSNPVTTPLTNGTATVTYPYPSRRNGGDIVTAAYSGDADFVGSSGTDTHTVNRALTTTTLTTGPDPSVVGQPVTFTTTVTPLAPGAGTPTGTVTLNFGDGTSPITTPLTHGTATTTRPYTTRTGSPYTVTATYHETSAFADSSGTDTHTVNRALTSTTVASGPDPSVVGQPVTFTTTVTPLAPGAGTPTGTVTLNFGDGTSPITTPLTNGTATTTRPYTTSTSSPYTITATYSGDTDFADSSGTDTHTVNRALTTTNLTTGPDPSVVGQPVTFTTTVTPLAPGAGTPTGTVTLNFGDGTSPITTPLTNGTATTTRPYTTRTGSPYTVTATYSGSDRFVGSSGTDAHTVDRALSATTVVSSPDPSAPAQNVTVEATVTAVPPGAGTPTGSVTFTVGNRSPVAVPLINGSATTSVKSLNVGKHGIIATYTGSTGFTSSTGTDTHTVTP